MPNFPRAVISRWKSNYAISLPPGISDGYSKRSGTSHLPNLAVLRCHPPQMCPLFAAAPKSCFTNCGALCPLRVPLVHVWMCWHPRVQILPCYHELSSFSLRKTAGKHERSCDFCLQYTCTGDKSNCKNISWNLSHISWLINKMLMLSYDLLVCFNKFYY